MKDPEAKEVRKMRESWIIDPIKSFMDGEEGEQKQVLITAGRNPTAIHDLVFWKAGKRAFDIINSSYDGDVTAADIKEFFYHGPADLINLWNRYKSVFEPLIHKGVIEIIPFGSEEPIQEFAPLSPNTDGFAEYYTVEPYIRAIDDVFDESNIRNSGEQWPFDRELVAAFFTICHIDFFAASVALERQRDNAYALVTHWFEKIDGYKHTKVAIERQQEFLKRKKSQAMNERRHAKRNEARQLVIDDWSLRRSEFFSIERAGIYYADWLERKGFVYMPRTVRDWIRDYADDNGIRL